MDINKVDKTEQRESGIPKSLVIWESPSKVFGCLLSFP